MIIKIFQRERKERILKKGNLKDYIIAKIHPVKEAPPVNYILFMKC